MGVREEAVRLSLDDDFTSRVIKAAAATALLERNLDNLDGTAVRSSRGTSAVTRDTESMARSVDKGSDSINQLTGRMRVLGEIAGAVGPALIPITAIGIPALSGLAAQFGFAAVAGGTMIGAFQGVGDALKAMNKAHLEPTRDNLVAAKIAMQDLSPAARDMVRQLRDMGPAMKGLRDTAATGLFPGMIEGFQSLEALLPKVERIVGAVAGELGEIASDSGASLASGRWADFFTFLETDAPAALRDMATAAGNTGHAMAEMWMAFDPLNDDFSQWLVDATASLDEWATGLSRTEGFAEFVDYIRSTGPQVADTLGSIGNALLQIVEAAAPIAGPVLQTLEALANVIASVADSDLGTPIFGAVAALSALNLAMRTTSALSKATFGGPAVAALRGQTAGYKTLAAAQREVAAASQALSMADLARSGAAVRAKNAQTALLSPEQKRGSVSEFVAATKAQAAAAERVTAAERARSAAVLESAKSAGKAAALVGGLAVVTSGLGDSLGITNTASLALMGSMAGPWGAALGAAAGATIDLAHANDDLRSSASAANAAMKSGDLQAMSEEYDKLAAKIKKTNDVGFWDPGDADAGLKKILANITGAMDDAEKKAANLAGSLAGAGAANAFTVITDGFADTSAAAARATGSVQGFQAALASLNGTLTRREAMRQYTESVLDARAAIQENGQTLTKTGQAFKGHTRAGLESSRMLDTIAARAVAAASQLSPLKGARYLQAARKDFVQAATGMGMGRTAARSLAAQLLTLGNGADVSRARVKAMRDEIARVKSKMVKMDEKGAAQARQRIAALQAAIARLQGKTIYINTIERRRFVQTGTTHPGGGAGARGMLWADGVRHYAYGDIANRHMPELAGPGPTRIWREPETQGEAYIPLANDDRRPRARAIAAETVSLLGGRAYFANGGLSFARGGVNGGDDDVARAHRNHAAAVNADTRALNRAKAARDRLISKRSELSGTVRDQFLSDPFEGGSVWTAGAGDPRSILKADIAQSKSFAHSLALLKKQGLDGAAMAAIAQTGDVGKAQALLSLGRAGIGQYESLYNQRASAAGKVGAYAGAAAYNPQISATNRELRLLRAEINHQRREAGGHARTAGRETGKAINRSASRAQRGKR